jgi:hypothetical protein
MRITIPANFARFHDVGFPAPFSSYHRAFPSLSIFVDILPRPFENSTHHSARNPEHSVSLTPRRSCIGIAYHERFLEPVVDVAGVDQVLDILDRFIDFFSLQALAVQEFLPFSHHRLWNNLIVCSLSFGIIILDATHRVAAMHNPHLDSKDLSTIYMYMGRLQVRSRLDTKTNIFRAIQTWSNRFDGKTAD